MGWTNPATYGPLIGGLALLVAFAFIERRAAEPMFDLSLLRIRAFSAGIAAVLAAAIARGGLQLMLVIWLQGIWLPLHGYSYTETPLWAGIFLLPLSAGFLVAGPLSGYLSDRFGARPFSTTGLLAFGAGILGLLLLPIDFSYWMFAVLIACAGIGTGMFAAPNTSAVMSSVPAAQRGVASGMRATFQNSGNLLSIGIFFSLMIAVLAKSLPPAMVAGLARQGVPVNIASQVAALPPVSSLFAAFLGINPLEHLLAPSGVLAHLSATQRETLTGTTFFPQLIAAPFHHGLTAVFTLAIALSLFGAVASFLRGSRARSLQTSSQES
jgi:MFS family permease